MRHLFFRCQNGHLFRDGCCPIDAWTHDQIGRATALFAQNPNIGLDDLTAAFAAELIRRMVIIESPTFPSSIECIYPKYYVIDGKIDETIDRDW